MECPKCFGDMDQVVEQPVDVQRCNDCHGLYFDQLSVPLLEQLGSDTSIDSGDEDIGAEYDEMVYVDCPKCDKIMDARTIDEPVRIRFEFCPSCHATFLDAGEYREYLTEDYIQEFKALLPKE